MKGNIIRAVAGIGPYRVKAVRRGWYHLVRASDEVVMSGGPMRHTMAVLDKLTENPTQDKGA